MFRILGSVNALNEKMGLNLTHHYINWVYNLHYLKGQGYYLKSRYPKVRLISCLSESNKDMNKDFLIVSGEWHNGLPYPTREGTLGGVFRTRFITSKSPFFPFDILCTHFSPFVLVIELSFDLCHTLFFFPNGFADKHTVIPNFNLVNQPSLDKILKAKVFVHSDSQLRAAHLILSYNPLSSSF